MDVSAVIVAATALVATLAGIRQAQRGRKDSLRQQEAANRLEAREQHSAEVESSLRHAHEEAEIAYRRLGEERAERTRLAAELAKAQSEREAALRGELQAALLDRSTLQSIVQDEIARESMRTQNEMKKGEDA